MEGRLAQRSPELQLAGAPARCTPAALSKAGVAGGFDYGQLVLTMVSDRTFSISGDPALLVVLDFSLPL